MQQIYIIIFFIIGTIFGSFYNVIGYRLPEKKSIIKPRSHCPKCKKELGFFDLIPIFSYLLRKGKCKYCKTKISAFYPIFEFLTGILFAISYLVFGFSIELIIALIFVSACIIIVISDILYMIILDEVLIVSIISILGLNLYKYGFSYNLLLNLLIPFVFMFLVKKIGDKVFKKESLGGGDIKLMSLFGLVLGYKITIFSVFLGAFLAFPISLYLLIKKKQKEIPFGPFLCLSAIILFFLKIDFNFLIKLLIN